MKALNLKDTNEAKVLSDPQMQIVVTKKREIKEAIRFNKKWFPVRQWLLRYDVDVAALPEEIRFRSNIEVYKLKELKAA